MAQLERRGAVLSNGLSIGAAGNSHITIIGDIRCVGGICVTVHKLLRVLDGEGANAKVQTVEYGYNVRVEGRGNLFRYDCPHGHRPFHHVHRFEVRSGDHEGTVDKIEPEDVPTLGDVLEEAERWFYDNYEWMNS